MTNSLSFGTQEVDRVARVQRVNGDRCGRADEHLESRIRRYPVVAPRQNEGDATLHLFLELPHHQLSDASG
jgi:hypothetical protein